MEIVIRCPHCKAEKRVFSALCERCGKFPAAHHQPKDFVARIKSNKAALHVERNHKVSTKDEAISILWG